MTSLIRMTCRDRFLPTGLDALNARSVTAVTVAGLDQP